MTMKLKIIVAAAALSMLLPAQVNAQLLGGLVDTVGGVVDSVGSTVESVTSGGDGGGGGSVGGGFVTASNGPAESGGLANVGIGDGGSNTNNLLDVSLGQRTLGGSVRRDGGNVAVGVNLLGGTDNTLLAGLNLGGLGLNLDAGLGIGSNGGASPGNPGGAGQPGFRGGTSGGLAALGSTNCSLQQARQILQFAADQRFSTRNASRWSRAASVKVVPLKVCSPTRKKLAQVLSQSSKMHQLWAAVSGDTLISTSLQRGRHSADDVFAVTNANGELTVYTY